MNNTLENNHNLGSHSEGSDTTSPWDILRDNNDNPFDLGDSAPAQAQPLAEEQKWRDNPFDLSDSTPDQSQPLAGEELVNDNPFDLSDSASVQPQPLAGEMAKDDPFDISSTPEMGATSDTREGNPFSIDDDSDVTPARSFTEEELAQNNPFDIDSAID